jgi:hypothetical protein
MLNKINGQYYCFDVIASRNFILQKNTEFSQADIDKISDVDYQEN